MLLPIIIYLTPCSLAGFPEKIVVLARLWGTRKMCSTGYKNASLKPYLCISNDVFSLQIFHAGCANRLGKKRIKEKHASVAW